MTKGGLNPALCCFGDIMKKPFKTWRTSDADKLKELVKQFNKKRAVHNSKVTPQPPKIKYSDLISDIHSRAEYNRVYSVYSRYLKPGAERVYKNPYGLRISQWERKEMQYAIRRINNERAKELARLNPATTKGTMGLVEANNLAPKTDYTATYTDTAHYYKYWKSAQKQANVDYRRLAYERYKENYIKALGIELNSASNYKKLLSLVKGFSGAELMQLSADNPILQLEFVYDLSLTADDKCNYIYEHFIYNAS